MTAPCFNITDQVIQSREYHLGEGSLTNAWSASLRHDRRLVYVSERVGNTAKASSYMKDSDYDNTSFTKIF